MTLAAGVLAAKVFSISPYHWGPSSRVNGGSSIQQDCHMCTVETSVWPL
jgi:hypothetical protein